MSQKSIDEYLLKYQEEQLTVLAVLGKIDISLAELSKYKGRLVEFAPVGNEPDREFLAGASFDPYVDVTVTRVPNKESAVFAFSLDYNKSLAVVKEVADISKMSLCKPTQDFFMDFKQSYFMEKINLVQAQVLSKAMEIDVSTMWGVTHYANFLEYHGISPDERIIEASKRFNVKLPG